MQYVPCLPEILCQRNNGLITPTQPPSNKNKNKNKLSPCWGKEKWSLCLCLGIHKVGLVIVFRQKKTKSCVFFRIFLKTPVSKLNFMKVGRAFRRTGFLSVRYPTPCVLCWSKPQRWVNCVLLSSLKWTCLHAVLSHQSLMVETKRNR